MRVKGKKTTLARSKLPKSLIIVETGYHIMGLHRRKQNDC